MGATQNLAFGVNYMGCMLYLLHEKISQKCYFDMAKNT